MKRQKFLTVFFVAFAFFLFAQGCKDKQTPENKQPVTNEDNKTQTSKSDSPNKSSLTVMLESKELYLSEPVAVENLIVYPLKRKQNVVEVEYFSLVEGLKQEVVIIKELSGDDYSSNSDNQIYRGGGAEVNAVEISNNSDKNLFILAGEVIIGGKQDRVVTCDLLFKPGEKKRVEVCCVEHGRWSVRDNSQGYNFSSVAVNTAGNEIRAKIQSKGKDAQSEVWEEVASQQSAIGNANTSDTYHKVVEYNAEKMDEIQGKFDDKLFKDKNICGFVACINGEIVGIEIFANSGIYNLFRERLLKGYILDSITVENKVTKDVKQQDVEVYLVNFAQMQEKALKAGLNKFEDKKIMGFSAECYADKEDMPVHSNAFNKK